MNCEIIAVGSELLSPYRQDTNSLFLTDRLLQLGVNVVFKTIVGDRLGHLTSAIRIALGRTDIVITMGGLGPTEDDLTRQAVAEALGIRLRRHPEIVGALYARFAARRAQMTENNARQADVLDGSVVLENARGTAPGQWLDTVYGEHRKLVILLPGPPTEVKAMFDTQCMDRLRSVVPKRTIATRTLKIAMIGESQADARIAPIYEGTNGIQAIDLAGRKLGLEGGEAVGSLLSDMTDTVRALDASDHPTLKAIAGRLIAAVVAVHETSAWLKERSGQADMLAGATAYLKLFGDTAGGWMLVKGALAASRLAAQGDADSYWRTKIGLAHVFAENVLARAPSLAAAIQMGADDLTATSPQALGATT